jgi:hypothetical protein
MSKPGLKRYRIKWGSGKTLKAIPVGFADRTFEGWLGAGAQVATDFTAPDREAASGKADQLFLMFLDRWLWLGAPSLRHRLQLLVAPGDLLRDVKGAIASAVLVQVRGAVVAGADDVQVFLSDPLGQATGTGLVAVPLLVGQKPFHQVKDKLDVRVEIVARCFPLALQPFIQCLSFL